MNHDETKLADGSVFGWLNDDTITALIIYYADVDDWSLCPNADVAEDRWPPFTGNESFRVRAHLRTGNPVDLAPLIGDTRNLVFWVPVVAESGSGIIAVKADLPPDPTRFVLPAGRYVHYKALRAGAALPSLGDLLADEHRVDLGPRFPLTSLHGEAD